MTQVPHEVILNHVKQMRAGGGAGDAVHVVGRKAALPQHLGHYPEEGAAVCQVGAVGYVRDFDVAQRDSLQTTPFSPQRTQSAQRKIFTKKGYEGSNDQLSPHFR